MSCKRYLVQLGFLFNRGQTLFMLELWHSICEVYARDIVCNRTLVSYERRLGKIRFAENSIKIWQNGGQTLIIFLILCLLIEKSAVLIYNFMNVFMSSCLIMFDVPLKKL